MLSIGSVAEVHDLHLGTENDTGAPSYRIRRRYRQEVNQASKGLLVERVSIGTGEQTALRRLAKIREADHPPAFCQRDVSSTAEF
jgi:hypothetical protein